MRCVDDYEIQPPLYKTIIEKSQCMHTISRLENGLMYIFETFESNVINDSPIYTKYKS